MATGAAAGAGAGRGDAGDRAAVLLVAGGALVLGRVVRVVVTRRVATGAASADGTVAAGGSFTGSLAIGVGVVTGGSVIGSVAKGGVVVASAAVEGTVDDTSCAVTGLSGSKTTADSAADARRTEIMRFISTGERTEIVPGSQSSFGRVDRFKLDGESNGSSAHSRERFSDGIADQAITVTTDPAYLFRAGDFVL